MKDSALWRVAPRLDDPGPDVGLPQALWVLEHICGWESNPQGEFDQRTMEDLLRWAEAHEKECRNEPSGPEIRSQWDKVPAGWFVQAPDGTWLEVGKTSYLSHTGKQMVSVRIGEDFHAFPRDPKGEVWARRGTYSDPEKEHAIQALQAAFTTAILHDEPPGQS